MEVDWHLPNEKPSQEVSYHGVREHNVQGSMFGRREKGLTIHENCAGDNQAHYHGSKRSETVSVLLCCSVNFVM